MGLPSYKLLEHEYSLFVGSRYAVSCNSGTSALHLALLALGIDEGSEVIVPDFTMAACGFAVSYVGARVVTVDCGEDLNINTEQIERHITRRTRAIIVVHVYGRVVNISDIRRQLRAIQREDIKIIEDACEAQGAVYKSKADITCYSFYKNKIIHAEEGGILTTNNKKYADRANYFKNMCFDSGHTYFHSNIGFNYRITDCSAHKALESLHDYEGHAKQRRQVEAWYNSLIPEKYQMPKRDAVWVYDTKIPFKKGVEGARHFFKPLSTMPMWKQKVGKNAKKFSKYMYLPVNPNMTLGDVKRIVKQCKI